MGKIFFDTAVSLDGFMAGEHLGPKNPIGDGGPSLHKWMYKQKAFWRTLGMNRGEEEGTDGRLIEEYIKRKTYHEKDNASLTWFCNSTFHIRTIKKLCIFFIYVYFIQFLA